MSEGELSSELRALIDADREAPGPGKEIEERLLARVLATAALPDPKGGDAAPASPAAAAPASGLVRAIAIFAVGAAAGAGTHAMLRPVEVKTERVVIEVPVHSPAAAPPITATSTPAAAAASSAAPIASSDGGARATPRAANTLARERALIDRARTALARRDAKDALAAIDAHERSFRTGELTEEREALAIQALLLAGRRPEAETRAAKFRRRFPGSIFQPLIDAALRGPAP